MTGRCRHAEPRRGDDSSMSRPDGHAEEFRHARGARPGAFEGRPAVGVVVRVPGQAGRPAEDSGLG